MKAGRSSFAQLIQHDRANRESKLWQGTFLDYLEKVREDPTITKLAHGRLHERIMLDGCITREERTHFL